MKKYRLEELMRLKYGKRQTHIECDNGTYNIYGSAGIIGKTNSYLYDSPSVLLGRKGTINNPIYTEQPFWCIDTMFYTEINSHKIVPKYLYYKLMTIDFDRFNESTGVPSLRVPTVNDITVSIHEQLDEQLRITNILGTIDTKININKQMIRLLDDYLSTVFDYKYITYKGENLIWNENIKKYIPKDWQIYYLGELFSFIKGKIPARLKDRYENAYDNIYLTIDTINGGQELYCSSVNMPYSKGNVLMVMDGAASGDVYVGFDGVVGSTFCMLKTKQSFVSNNFLYQILRSYSTNYKKTNVGSTVPHANKDYIQSMQIALPKEIDTEFDLVRNQIIRLTKQIKILKKIRDFLLPLLVNGQVKVQ